MILIPEEEKRLIHMSVSAKKNFVFIKIENYCESEIIKNQHSLITTTKQTSRTTDLACEVFVRRQRSMAAA